jgi:hypothetical protein
MLRSFVTVLWVTFVPFLATSVAAQPSRLAGRIADSSGAAAADVLITATNDGTNQSDETISGRDGLYVFPDLRPGTYTVTVFKQRFRPERRAGIIVSTATAATLDVTLQVGEVTQQVEVTASLPLIESQSGSVGTVIDRQFVANLPLNGRSFQSLLELVPGVVVVEPDIALGTGQFSVNGQRSNANSFTVDGVSANTAASFTATSFQQAAGALPGVTAVGSTQSLVSVDALEEFKIQTSTMAPEFGRQPGGQISLTTRSGTNRFTGSAFEYFRNEALDANDWFNNRDHRDKLPLRQHQFGGAFGGPLSIPGVVSGRDRAFFFASHESLRLRQPQPDVRNVVVPSAAARSQATGVVKQVLESFPAPNAPSLPGDPTDTERYIYRISYPSDFHATSVRVDGRPSPAINLFGRVSRTPSSYSEFVFANQENRFSSDNDSVTLGATWTRSSRLVGDTRVNWSRTRGRFAFAPRNVDGANVIPDEAIFPRDVNPDTASVNLNLALNTPTGPVSINRGKSLGNEQEQYNVVSSLTWLAGAHEIKGGIDWRRLQPVIDFRTVGITHAFGGVTPFLQTGRVQSVTIQALAPTAGFKFDNLSLYVQDTWRATPRLTMTYGARYELNPPPSGDRIPYTFTDVNNLLTTDLAPAGTPLWETSYNNFAPRVDAAYRLPTDTETVIRGGVGLFYDLGNGPALRGYSSFPFTAVRTLTNQPFPVPDAQLQPPAFTPDARPINSTFYVFDPELALPYTWQWNVSLERALGATQSVTLSYVGSRSERLLRTEQFRNRLLPSDAAEGIPPIVFVNPGLVSPSTQVHVTRNAADASYHALQAQYQRRLSKGVQALVSYTLSEAIDTVSSEAAVGFPAEGAPGFPTDLEAERGPSDFDVRHVLTGALTWELPSPSNRAARAMVGGWGLDVTSRWRSGTPLHVYTTVPDPLNLGANRRVDVVPGVDPWIDDGNAPGGRRLNPAAFAVPALGRQGNMRRNSLRWNAMHQSDLSLRRTFALVRQWRLQLRADVFNVFNTVNFAEPNALFSNSPLFGVSSRLLSRALGPGGSSGGLSPLYQSGGARSVQLSARVSF